MIIAQKPSLQRRPAAKTVEFIGPDPVFVAFSGGKRPFREKMASQQQLAANSLPTY
jgi:hypothetical protein